jgi:16S rRNA (guanine527-N7)-methyltransferase
VNEINNTRAALDAALSRLNLDVDQSKRDLLLRHLALLFEKNRVLNLTRIDSLEDAVVLHIEDSLSIYPEFQKTEGRFCDIGTGGGFPGLPLGIVSGRPGILLDSVKKKAKAVDEFINALGLSGTLQSRGMRSEELALEMPASFSCVVARAVSSLAAVEELACPLLEFGGSLIAMRGTEIAEDLEAASAAADVLGLELVEQRSFSIGDGRASRSVYRYQRVRESQKKLPRRPGMAQKKPLGY